MQSMPNNVEQYCWSHFDAFTFSFCQAPFTSSSSSILGVLLYAATFTLFFSLFYSLIASVLQLHKDFILEQMLFCQVKFCKHYAVDIFFFFFFSHSIQRIFEANESELVFNFLVLITFNFYYCVHLNCYWCQCRFPLSLDCLIRPAAIQKLCTMNHMRNCSTRTTSAVIIILWLLLMGANVTSLLGAWVSFANTVHPISHLCIYSIWYKIVANICMKRREYFDNSLNLHFLIRKYSWQPSLDIWLTKYVTYFGGHLFEFDPLSVSS